MLIYNNSRFVFFRWIALLIIGVLITNPLTHLTYSYQAQFLSPNSSLQSKTAMQDLFEKWKTSKTSFTKSEKKWISFVNKFVFQHSATQIVLKKAQVREFVLLGAISREIIKNYLYSSGQKELFDSVDKSISEQDRNLMLLETTKTVFAQHHLSKKDYALLHGFLKEKQYSKFFLLLSKAVLPEVSARITPLFKFNIGVITIADAMNLILNMANEEGMLLEALDRLHLLNENLMDIAKGSGSVELYQFAIDASSALATLLEKVQLEQRFPVYLSKQKETNKKEKESSFELGVGNEWSDDSIPIRLDVKDKQLDLNFLLTAKPKENQQMLLGQALEILNQHFKEMLSVGSFSWDRLDVSFTNELSSLANVSRSMNQKKSSVSIHEKLLSVDTVLSDDGFLHFINSIYGEESSLGFSLDKKRAAALSLATVLIFSIEQTFSNKEYQINELKRFLDKLSQKDLAYLGYVLTGLSDKGIRDPFFMTYLYPRLKSKDSQKVRYSVLNKAYHFILEKKTGEKPDALLDKAIGWYQNYDFNKTDGLHNESLSEKWERFLDFYNYLGLDKVFLSKRALAKVKRTFGSKERALAHFVERSSKKVSALVTSLNYLELHRNILNVSPDEILSVLLSKKDKLEQAWVLFEMLEKDIFTDMLDKEDPPALDKKVQKQVKRFFSKVNLTQKVKLPDLTKKRHIRRGIIIVGIAALVTLFSWFFVVQPKSVQPVVSGVSTVLMDTNYERYFDEDELYIWKTYPDTPKAVAIDYFDLIKDNPELLVQRLDALITRAPETLYGKINRVAQRFKLKALALRFAELSGETSFSWFLQAADSSRVDIREMVAICLSRIDTPESLNLSLLLTHDEDTLVRYYALKSAVLLNPNDAGVQERLARLIANTEEKEYIRSLAFLHLAGEIDDAKVAAVGEFFQDYGQNLDSLYAVLNYIGDYPDQRFFHIVEQVTNRFCIQGEAANYFVSEAKGTVDFKEIALDLLVQIDSGRANTILYRIFELEQQKSELYRQAMQKEITDQGAIQMATLWISIVEAHTRSQINNLPEYMQTEELIQSFLSEYSSENEQIKLGKYLWRQVQSSAGASTFSFNPNAVTADDRLDRKEAVRIRIDDPDIAGDQLTNLMSQMKTIQEVTISQTPRNYIQGLIHRLRRANDRESFSVLVSEFFKNKLNMRNAILNAILLSPLFWEGLFYVALGIVSLLNVFFAVYLGKTAKNLSLKFGTMFWLWIQTAFKLHSRKKAKQLFKSLIDENISSRLSPKNMKSFVLKWSEYVYLLEKNNINSEAIGQTLSDLSKALQNVSGFEDTLFFLFDRLEKSTKEGVHTHLFFVPLLNLLLKTDTTEREMHVSDLLNAYTSLKNMDDTYSIETVLKYSLKAASSMEDVFFLIRIAAAFKEQSVPVSAFLRDQAPLFMKLGFSQDQLKELFKIIRKLSAKDIDISILTVSLQKLLEKTHDYESIRLVLEKSLQFTREKFSAGLSGYAGMMFSLGENNIYPYDFIATVGPLALEIDNNNLSSSSIDKLADQLKEIYQNSDIKSVFSRYSKKHVKDDMFIHSDAYNLRRLYDTSPELFGLFLDVMDYARQLENAEVAINPTELMRVFLKANDMMDDAVLKNVFFDFDKKQRLIKSFVFMLTEERFARKELSFDNSTGLDVYQTLDVIDDDVVLGKALFFSDFLNYVSVSSEDLFNESWNTYVDFLALFLSMNSISMTALYENFSISEVKEKKAFYLLMVNFFKHAERQIGDDGFAALKHDFFTLYCEQGLKTASFSDLSNRLNHYVNVLTHLFPVYKSMSFHTVQALPYNKDGYDNYMEQYIHVNSVLLDGINQLEKLFKNDDDFFAALDALIRNFELGDSDLSKQDSSIYKSAFLNAILFYSQISSFIPDDDFDMHMEILSRLGKGFFRFERNSSIRSSSMLRSEKLHDVIAKYGKLYMYLLQVSPSSIAYLTDPSFDFKHILSFGVPAGKVRWQEEIIWMEKKNDGYLCRLTKSSKGQLNVLFTWYVKLDLDEDHLQISNLPVSPYVEQDASLVEKLEILGDFYSELNIKTIEVIIPESFSIADYGDVIKLNNSFLLKKREGRLFLEKQGFEDDLAETRGGVTFEDFFREPATDSLSEVDWKKVVTISNRPRGRHSTIFKKEFMDFVDAIELDLENKQITLPTLDMEKYWVKPILLSAYEQMDIKKVVVLNSEGLEDRYEFLFEKLLLVRKELTNTFEFEEISNSEADWKATITEKFMPEHSVLMSDYFDEAKMDKTKLEWEKAKQAFIEYMNDVEIDSSNKQATVPNLDMETYPFLMLVLDYMYNEIGITHIVVNNIAGGKDAYNLEFSEVKLVRKEKVNTFEFEREISRPTSRTMDDLMLAPDEIDVSFGDDSNRDIADTSSGEILSQTEIDQLLLAITGEQEAVTDNEKGNKRPFELQQSIEMIVANASFLSDLETGKISADTLNTFNYLLWEEEFDSESVYTNYKRLTSNDLKFIKVDSAYKDNVEQRVNDMLTYFKDNDIIISFDSSLCLMGAFIIEYLSLEQEFFPLMSETDPGDSLYDLLDRHISRIDTQPSFESALDGMSSKDCVDALTARIREHVDFDKDDVTNNLDLYFKELTTVLKREYRYVSSFSISQMSTLRSIIRRILRDLGMQQTYHIISYDVIDRIDDVLNHLLFFDADSSLLQNDMYTLLLMLSDPYILNFIDENGHVSDQFLDRDAQKALVSILDVTGVLDQLVPLKRVSSEPMVVSDEQLYSFSISIANIYKKINFWPAVDSKDVFKNKVLIRKRQPLELAA